MNCEKAYELISRSLDRELSASDDAALREHLGRCPSCREVEGDQQRLATALHVMPSPARSEEKREALRDAMWRKIGALQPPAARLSFRITSLAAIVLLSAIVVVLSLQLDKARKAIARITSLGQVRHEGMPGLPSFPGLVSSRSAGDERGIAEHVQAFSAVQDYLGGAVKWMAVDGNQVEIGMSGSGAPTPVGAGRPRKVIVLTFQYVERRSTGESQVLSNPQFVLLSGEEASVRLARKEKEGEVEDLFRYRVRADRDDGGQIRAQVTFSPEMADKGRKPAEIVSPITAALLIREGTAVLLGASGDASRRRELYMWAVVRPAAPNGRNGSGKGRDL